MAGDETLKPQTSESSAVPGEAQIIWVLWLTYGAFYFCRTNISAAIPGIEQELELSKAQIGLMLGSLKLTYGFGQFLNGQLAERFSARRLLAIGMLGSALLNVVFGFWTAFYFLIFVWACNGYFQSLGWTPTMRVAANWFSATRRGKAIGIIGTGYQATAALTFVIAGFSAELLGWRGALYVPALLLAAASVHMLLFMRESPDESSSGAGQRVIEARLPSDEPRVESDDGSARTRGAFFRNVMLTLSNPKLWPLAVSLAFLNACRYGFLDWGLTHLKETQDTNVSTAALKYAVLPLGGIAGAFLSGWATDRFFSGRRAPVVCILLVLLGFSTLAYNSITHAGLIPSLILLALIGFFIYGPQVLLVGTAPVDLARKGVPAAAVGFVNFMGYMGAFAGDQVTGHLVDRYEWRVAVFFWAGCAFAAAISSAFLWNASAEAHKGEEPVQLAGGEQQ